MIYICIPAHDEAQTIGPLLWKIRRVLAEFPRDYQILVLDDASTDHTAEALEPYTRALPLTVIRAEKRVGYAAAVERLLREAARISTHPKRDTVIVLQGDFTESPEDIPGLVKRIEGGADVVGTVAVDPVVQAAAGAKHWWQRGAPLKVRRLLTEGPEPRSRRLTRAGLPALLGRAGLSRDPGDPLSGFRAYRVATLRRALAALGDGTPLMRADGWAANAELLRSVLPHARRAESAEVTLRYAHRDRPTRFKAWPTVKSVWSVARLPRLAPVPAPAAGAAADAPAPPADEAPPKPKRQRPPRQRKEPAPPTQADVPQPSGEGAPEQGAAPGGEGKPRRSRPRGRRKPKQKPEGDTSHVP